MLASTSGWSNGLMPITAPATAVANSQLEELAAEVVAVGELDPHDGCPAALERLDRGVLRGVGPAPRRR